MSNALPLRVPAESLRFLLAGGLATLVNWLIRFPLSLILPFDAAVLDFHTSQRPVHTFSAAQVRQPLQTDTARASLYGRALDPLRAALAEHAVSGRLQVRDQQLGTFDGAVQIGIMECAPHLLDGKQRPVHTVVGHDEAVELIKRPATLPQDAPRQVPRTEIQ